MVVHESVPSWRFKETGIGWPFVQIVAPADIRLVTRPADPRQVPRPGSVEIVAKLFGRIDDAPQVAIDDGPPTPMTADGTLWRAHVEMAAGLRRVTISAGGGQDTIDVLASPVADIPRRGASIALGQAVHAIGAWREHGIEGTRLGPNRNGGHP